MNEKRIIDRDVETYQIEVEYCESQLRRALPADEKKWQHRLTSARVVLQALKYHASLYE